jgi:hypothetical protein
VDGVSPGDGTCVRMPMTPGNATFPINDLESDAMACGEYLCPPSFSFSFPFPDLIRCITGYDGMKGVARVCPVTSGSEVKFQWREVADDSDGGVIDPEHKGPCAVYAKAVQSAIRDRAVGGRWFKIWEEGYDNATSQWCTEKVIQNGGELSQTADMS